MSSTSVLYTDHLRTARNSPGEPPARLRPYASVGLERFGRSALGRHWKSRGVKSAAAAVGVLVVAATAVTITNTQAAPDDAGAPLAITNTLREKAAIPGTAWAVDPGTNK